MIVLFIILLGSSQFLMLGKFIQLLKLSLVTIIYLLFVNVGILTYQVIYCPSPSKVESRRTEFQVPARSGRSRRRIPWRREGRGLSHPGPLRLAHSVFRQSQTRWPYGFVDPFTSLYKLSWANFFLYC